MALLPLQGSAALLAACAQGNAPTAAVQPVEHADHCAGASVDREQTPKASCAGSMACCAAACMPMTVRSGHPDEHVTPVPVARELPIHSVVPAMPERPPRSNG